MWQLMEALELMKKRLVTVNFLRLVVRSVDNDGLKLASLEYDVIEFALKPNLRNDRERKQHDKEESEGKYDTNY